MADWTKSESADAITHQEVTHPATVDGGAISCVDDDAIYLVIRWASIEAAANTNAGSFLVMGSDKTTGDENWAILAEIGTPVVTAAKSDLDSGGEAIGQTVIGVSATASLVSGTWCYIEDTTTATDSEWCYILTIVTNDTITILDGLAVAKDDADDCWSDAQVVGLTVDVHAFQRFKVVYVHQGAAAANSAIWVTYSKATDFS
jgi:hypothetical protein